MTHAVHFPRFATHVLPGFDPNRHCAASYDTASHGPTLSALRAFKDQGRLPPLEAPGKYALVAYEEAALARYLRVQVFLEPGEGYDLSPVDLPSLRALALLELESYVAGILSKSFEEACLLACGLLALPAILDDEGRRALAEDLHAIVASPPRTLSPEDAWQFALCLPAVSVAAGVPGEALRSIEVRVLERRADVLRSALAKLNQDPVALIDSGEFVAIDLELGRVEHAPSLEELEGLSPCFGAFHNQIQELIERWSPGMAARLHGAADIVWLERNVMFRASPIEGGPPTLQRLTIEERR